MTNVKSEIQDVLAHFEMWVSAVQGAYKVPKKALTPFAAEQRLLQLLQDDKREVFKEKI